MSAMGALAYSLDGRRSRVLLLFQPGAVRAEAILRFLRHLRRHVRGRVVLLWDSVHPTVRRSCEIGLREITAG
jgi:hypothetical protein